MSAGIWIEVDGQPVDLAQVTWYLRAPCGCVSGATVGHMDYGGVHKVVTADEALAQFYETKHEREKYVDLGFTVFPDLHSKCSELLSAKCPHEPRWGYAKPPKPEGLTWAAVYALGSRPKLQHLVPTEYVEQVKARDHLRGDGFALCRSKSWHWNDESYATDGTVECKRCVAKAVA